MFNTTKIAKEHSKNCIKERPKNHIPAILCLLLLSPVASSSPGSLLGQSITHTCEQCGPPFSQSFVAKNGIDLHVSFDGAIEYTIDVSETALEIVWQVDRYTRSPLIFTFSWDKEKFRLDNSELDPISTLNRGFYFSEGEIGVDLGDASIRNGDNLKLFLRGNSPTNTVSEPPLYILLGPLLMGVLKTAKKKLRKQIKTDTN